ncbi:MAG TPA: hypothetical protein VMH81_30095 [Bryobacteraceae bacterium]|nr:hypothetical protein [Bryobacteraceae bacterium]
MGEQEPALDRRRLLPTTDRRGCLKVDPDFDALRGDNRFAGLPHRIRF